MCWTTSLNLPSKLLFKKEKTKSSQSRRKPHNTVLIAATFIGAIAPGAYAADDSTTTSPEDWRQTVLIEPFNRGLELDLDAALAVEDTTDSTDHAWYQSVLLEPFNRSLGGELTELGTNDDKFAKRRNAEKQ